ncbi:hypothetical protein Btru_029628 [Bulinus truncatus]|nr:hypothetical protein Btru_029628 [Bulinus truncatus]
MTPHFTTVSPPAALLSIGGALNKKIGIMKFLFVALAIVATASAAVIVNPPHNPDNAKRNLQTIAQEIQALIDGVTTAIGSGKREQDINLVDIANTATAVIHALDVALNGAGKRNLQTIAQEIQALIDGVTTAIGSGKRNLQTIAQEIQALIDGVTTAIGSGKRNLQTIAQEIQALIDGVTTAIGSGKREQDINLVDIANTATAVIHALDVALNGAGKRNLQTIAQEIQALIDGVTTAIGSGKRNLQTIAQEIQALIDGVTTAIGSGKREQDINLVEIANTATAVIHALDVALNGAGKRNLQTIAQEIQALIDGVTTAIGSGKRNLQTIAQEIQALIDGVTTAIGSGKREQDINLVEIANTATAVIHALDVALNGAGKRNLQTIAQEIQALIDGVTTAIGSGKRNLQTIAQEIQALIDGVTTAIGSGKREQDINLVDIANTATAVIHALDVALNGAGKRNLQTIAQEIQALIDGVTTAISGKRNLQTVAQEIQTLIDTVSGIFNGGSGKRNLQTIAQEIQALIDGVTTAIGSGKREQDINLVEIANTATAVIHALDVALNGAGKRNLQTIAQEIQALIDGVTTAISGKRNLQTIAQEIQALIDGVTTVISSGKRNLQTIAQEIQALIDGVTTAIGSGKREQDINLVEIANTATAVIHALDVALNGAGKRNLQTIAQEIQALIDGVTTAISGKRNLQTIAQEIQALIDGVTTVISSGKRNLQTIAQEIQALIDGVTTAIGSGKREQDINLVEIANTATAVIHALDVALNGAGKRNLLTIAQEIQALIDGVTTVVQSG